MNFIRNRNFRAGPQTSLEGFICPQNSDKQQKIKVFGRSGGQFGACFLSFFIRKANDGNCSAKNARKNARKISQEEFQVLKREGGRKNGYWVVLNE